MNFDIVILVSLDIFNVWSGKEEGHYCKENIETKIAMVVLWGGIEKKCKF